jgi:hypothetical protein
MAVQGSWRKDAVNAAEFDAWDKRMKRKCGFFAGLRFFEGRIDSGLTIAYRHWPHKLCWDWLVRIHTVRPKYDGKRRFLFWHRQSLRGGQLWLWFWCISWVWQDSDWMVKDHFKREWHPPTVIWKHQVTAAVKERENVTVLQ